MDNKRIINATKWHRHESTWERKGNERNGTHLKHSEQHTTNTTNQAKTTIERIKAWPTHTTQQQHYTPITQPIPMVNEVLTTPHNEWMTTHTPLFHMIPYIFLVFFFCFFSYNHDNTHTTLSCDHTLFVIVSFVLFSRDAICTVGWILFSCLVLVVCSFCFVLFFFKTTITYQSIFCVLFVWGFLETRRPHLVCNTTMPRSTIPSICLCFVKGIMRNKHIMTWNTPLHHTSTHNTTQHTWIGQGKNEETSKKHKIKTKTEKKIISNQTIALDETRLYDRQVTQKTIRGLFLLFLLIMNWDIDLFVLFVGWNISIFLQHHEIEF